MTDNTQLIADLSKSAATLQRLGNELFAQLLLRTKAAIEGGMDTTVIADLTAMKIDIETHGGGFHIQLIDRTINALK